MITASGRAPGVLNHPPIPVEKDDRSQPPPLNDGEELPASVEPMENEQPHTENRDETRRKD